MEEVARVDERNERATVGGNENSERSTPATRPKPFFIKKREEFFHAASSPPAPPIPFPNSPPSMLTQPDLPSSWKILFFFAVALHYALLAFPETIT